MREQESFNAASRRYATTGLSVLFFFLFCMLGLECNTSVQARALRTSGACFEDFFEEFGHVHPSGWALASLVQNARSYFRQSDTQFCVDDMLSGHMKSTLTQPKNGGWVGWNEGQKKVNLLWALQQQRD